MFVATGARPTFGPKLIRDTVDRPPQVERPNQAFAPRPNRAPAAPLYP